MLVKFLFTCNAVFPIIIVIATGYFLKRIKLLPQSFFPMLNKLSFRCCLPCLLFYNVYNVENISDIAEYSSVVLFAIASILIFYAVGFFVSVFATKDPKQKGVLLQASYRSNYAIIGISLATSLCVGKDQTPVIIASILSSVSIPLFNVLATIALTIFVEESDEASDEKSNEKSNNKIKSFFAMSISIFKKICTNPLILGVFIGIVVLVIRNFIPNVEFCDADGTVKIKKLFTIKQNLPFVYKSIQPLASAASTIALIALGGNFEFTAVAKLKKQIIIGTFTRVVLCPAVCLVAAYKFGFRSLEFPALIALYGTPIAVSSVPMASEMGNDAELAGQLVVWTTLASAFTLFITIFVCSALGIFNV